MKINFNHVNKYTANLPNINVKEQNNISFKEILANQLIDSHLKISKHAEERLNQRNIDLSNEDWSLIVTKVNEARQKGVNDSLVLIKDAALIINAKNKTVITAMGREEVKSQIITNINGAIIIN